MPGQRARLPLADLQLRSIGPRTRGSKVIDNRALVWLAAPALILLAPFIAIVIAIDMLMDRLKRRAGPAAESPAIRETRKEKP
jgi:hypothetical protein